jgi:3-hydroxyisobutyryl-CoA hydrolase
MPETTIGFFPDVGGSFFLPRLDGEIGTYLSLTSERLQGVQAFYAGIATHYMDSSVLAPLTTRLSELVFDDFASFSERLDLVNNTIGEFTSNLPSPDIEKAKTGNISGELRVAIDRCFRFNSIQEIISALEAETSSSSAFISDWAKATLKTIGIRSPTSLKVTLQQLRLGRSWNIAEAFIKEHAMAKKFMAHPDFTEGVSARLINKPPTNPAWNPPKLDGISARDVDKFFSLPSEDEQLHLIDPLPGSRVDTAYHDYPHARFALPREANIRAIVMEKGEEGRKAVMKEVLSQWKQKIGVKEKLNEVLARKTKTGEKGEVIWENDRRANL